MEPKVRGSERAVEERLLLGRKQVEAAIVARAWKDEAFRAKLLEDPKAALADMGIRLPDDAEVTVREEPRTRWDLVLPKKPNPVGELSDEDLKQVTGAGISQVDQCQLVTFGGTFVGGSWSWG